jgi:hypothetical protein
MAKRGTCHVQRELIVSRHCAESRFDIVPVDGRRLEHAQLLVDLDLIRS